MVKITSVLLRSPVIKFRKGIGRGPPPSAAAAPSAPSAPPAPGPSPPAAAAAPAGPPVAAASSATIPDINLPPRYRRRPPSEEEIDCINGGGIV